MTLHAFIRTALALALPFALAAAPAAAKGGPKKTNVTAKPASAGAKGPKTTATARGPKMTATGKGARSTGKPTTTARGGGKAKSHGRPTTTTASSTKPGKGHKATGKAAMTDGGGTTVTDPTLNRAQQRLASDPKFRERMESRLAGRLPAGMTIDQAAAGFRNLGQFIAAVNVSQNLGISFTELRARMIGVDPVTGLDPTDSIAPMSLGQAIQAVRGLDATSAEQTASAALAHANAELGVTTTTATGKKKRQR